MPTVVITGATGLLGRSVLKAFKSSQNFDQVIGTCFSRTGPDLTKLDLTDSKATGQFIQETKPDVVVHTAAQRFPDKCEGEEFENARKLNAEATEILALSSEKVGARMIYISTDYVFDGKKSEPYLSGDKRNPLSNYGRLKADGEDFALKNNHIVLRIPVLYGDVEYLDESAVTTLLKKIKDNSSNAIISNFEPRRPAHVEDISCIILQIAEKILTESDKMEGIFQYSGPEKMTKYGMIKIMADVFNFNMDHIQGDDKEPATGATRPFDVSMDISRLSDLGISPQNPLSFKDGIKKSLQKWV